MTAMRQMQSEADALVIFRQLIFDEWSAGSMETLSTIPRDEKTASELSCGMQ